MDAAQRQLVSRYLELFFRHRLILIVAFFLLLPVGLGVYLRSPKIYQTTSLLSYESQKVSPNKMSPDLQSRLRDIVSTLTQLVTSRTNLENLINSLDLYKGLRTKLPMEDVVALMRQQIQIRPLAKEGDVFLISYSYSEPEKVVRVTNALAAKFIEENLKYREERATETQSYTSDELQMAKETMDRKEAVMRDYKISHYNEMPEQQQINISRLTALQEQYQGKQESIQDLERTLVLVQDQINNRRLLIDQELRSQTLFSGSTEGTGKEADAAALPVDQQLAKLKLLLERLQGRYTEKHPEIKRLKSAIERLEQEQAQATSDVFPVEPAALDSGTGDDVAAVTPAERQSTVDSVILRLETQLKNIQLNIDSIKAEKQELKAIIDQYEAWIAAAPAREAEWSALTREYGQLKRHYDFLVAQDLEAKSMLNLERRQKGSQFKIEDPARLPEKPIRPDFLKIMAICVAGGMGCVAGTILLIDFLDGSFRDPDALELAIGLPLLSTIPHVVLSSEKTKARRKAVLVSVLIVMLCLGVSAVFFIIWRKGLIIV